MDNHFNEKKCFVNDCGTTGHIGSRWVTRYLLKKYQISHRNVVPLTAKDNDFERILLRLKNKNIGHCIFNGEGCFALSSGDRKKILSRLNRCLEEFDKVDLVNVTLEDSLVEWALCRKPDSVIVRDIESVKFADGFNCKFEHDGCYLYASVNVRVPRLTFNYVAVTASMSEDVSQEILKRKFSRPIVTFDMETYFLKGIKSEDNVFNYIYLISKNLIKILSGKYGKGLLYEFKSLFSIFILKYSREVVTGRYHAALISLAMGKNTEVIGYGAEKFDRIRKNYDLKFQIDRSQVD
jgi:hypothetical protein